MAQASDNAHGPREQQQLRPGIATSKRKPSADHPEASARAAARRQTVNDDREKLANPGTQIDLAAGTATTKSSHEPAVAEVASVPPGGEPPRAARRAETEDSVVHGDQQMQKNGGSTVELPIVIEDDDDDDTNTLSCPEPEPAAPWCGDNTVVSPFGYTTWDPTDGGKYELLSTYMPPPCLDPDEEDALWGLAAMNTQPDLYTSPDNIFWGTPEGVWTLY
jgi:hypothetical protein